MTTPVAVEAVVLTEAIDRAERFAKSLNTTQEEHDDIMVAVLLARRALPPHNEELARLRDALEPFARLQLPKRRQGNAAFYSLLHADIEHAQTALSSIAPRQEDQA